MPLVLPRCPATSDVLLGWPVSNRTLDWLDLSFSKIDDRLFIEPTQSSTQHRWDVRRLNVESTQVTDASLSIIAKMPRLEELDLSRCDITDGGLEALRGHKTLKTLWLSECPISDLSIDLLLKIPQLESVHLFKTKVTPSGWARLLAGKPRLKSKSTAP